MNILLSNDDGFMSPGINILRKELEKKAVVLSVAPDRNRSGASNSLTLDFPLRVTQQAERVYSINGTPTDCVHLALTGLYGNAEPDIVISGINAGANMGDDVIYSGTVAAAMEGRNLGLPAIAVSLASHEQNHYETAALAVTSLLGQLSDLSLSDTTNSSEIVSATILNINVPDIPWDKIKGFQATRLGKRHKAEPVIRTQDPRGKEIFWVGPVGDEADAGEGTDFYAVQNNYISVTPLHIDLTQHTAIKITGDWLCDL